MTSDPPAHAAWSRRSVLGLLGAAPVAAGGLLAATGAAQAAQPIHSGQKVGGGLHASIQEIIHRAEFRGSRWGMRFRSLDSGRSVYAMNSNQLFVASSAFKVFPAGAAFSALGPGYRFRTPVYRTGPVVSGVLRGDLVLVASGDLLIGGRVRRDGSVIVPDPDHTYGAAPLPGDPVGIIRDLARQVAAYGIRRVHGRVRVDASLFRHGEEDVAFNGTTVPVSPMMINDNTVDLVVVPGDRVGDPPALRMSPDTGCLRLVNEVRTVAADAANPARVTVASDVANPDGTRTVVLTGDVHIGREVFAPYYVREPVAFAERIFVAALREAGVRLAAHPPATPAVHHAAARRLAEHVSPPLSEQMKVMLKVSSNVHTVHWPYLTGAIAAGDGDHAEAAGKAVERDLWARAGLEREPEGASENRYAPDFFVPFLSYVARQPYYPEFRQALPIMGRDGSLAGVQVGSPAAGHVFAKTGSGGRIDPTTGQATGYKGLAGYIGLTDGRRIAFAEFMEVPIPSPEASAEVLGLAGEALGEIATAIYESHARSPR